MLVARDVMSENPGSNKKALVTKAKAVVAEDDARERLQHAQSLECQGQVMEVYRGRCCQDLVQDSPEAPTRSPKVLSKCGPRHSTSQCQSG